MRLILQRVKHDNEATEGTLYLQTDSQELKLLCKTLEDPPQKKKIYGNTRIPEGIYEITMRKAGRIYRKYSAQGRFRSLNVKEHGMPWIRGVKNFKWIIIHCGNSHKDTEGCILVGQTFVNNRLFQSSEVFRTIYPFFVEAAEQGEKITIDVRNEYIYEAPKSLFYTILDIIKGFLV